MATAAGRPEARAARCNCSRMAAWLRLWGSQQEALPVAVAHAHATALGKPEGSTDVTEMWRWATTQHAVAKGGVSRAMSMRRGPLWSTLMGHGRGICDIARHTNACAPSGCARACRGAS
eukprot:6320978-Alexandrium_andersonii.AAC.1